MQAGENDATYRANLRVKSHGQEWNPTARMETSTGILSPELLRHAQPEQPRAKNETLAIVA